MSEADIRIETDPTLPDRGTGGQDVQAIDSINWQIKKGISR